MDLVRLLSSGVVFEGFNAFPPFKASTQITEEKLNLFIRIHYIRKHQFPNVMITSSLKSGSNCLIFGHLMSRYNTRIEKQLLTTTANSDLSIKVIFRSYFREI